MSSGPSKNSPRGTHRGTHPAKTRNASIRRATVRPSDFDIQDDTTSPPTIVHPGRYWIEGGLVEGIPPVEVLTPKSARVVPERKAYSVPETAALLAVHRNTVYALIASGQLDACRVASKIRVTEEAIDRYLRDGTATFVAVRKYNGRRR